MLLPALLSGACAVALAALLVAERRGSKRGRYVCKPLASAAFLAVALAGGATGPGYERWILIGLVLGAGGDLALMLPGSRAFLAGLVLFLLGHLGYVVACTEIAPLAHWAGAHALPPIAAAAVVLAWLWPHLGSMRVPVIAYVIVITAMVIGALTPLRLGLTGPQVALLAAGALAFFASDLAVARERFVAPGFSNRAWGLPAYYAGQLLFAWSAIS